MEILLNLQPLGFYRIGHCCSLFIVCLILISNTEKNRIGAMTFRLATFTPHWLLFFSHSGKVCVHFLNNYLCTISNFDINFLNFCHLQFQNFKISNLYERYQNFGVFFWKYQKQNQRSKMHFDTSWKPSVIPLKFCEMSLVLWNLMNDCKILQFLIKFCKRTKDFF